jgi:tetratricopeptide (TPR) repeat protein
MYRSNEQFAPAIETFRQIAEVDPDMASRGEVQVIETYRAAKDYAKAEETAKADVAKYPDDRVLSSVYASTLADTGKYDAAIAQMKKLLAAKTDRESLIATAQIYEKAKRYPEMAQAIDDAEKISKTKEDRETVLFMRGAMYERQKKYEQAEAEFRKVLDLNPENSSALNYLGYMLADRGVRLQEALQLISKALEEEPGNGAYLDSLGWVYYRLSRYPEAETNLKLALDKMSGDPTVHDHLGDVYLRQGKVKEAIAQWEMALKNWDATAPSEQEPAEMSKVHKKLESARVRLAKENNPPR